MAEYSFPKRQASTFVADNASVKNEAEGKSFEKEIAVGGADNAEFHWFDHSETKVVAGDLGIVGLSREGIILKPEQLEKWRVREDAANVPHIEAVKLSDNEFLIPVARNK